jgi:hypothetical protein
MGSPALRDPHVDGIHRRRRQLDQDLTRRRVRHGEFHQFGRIADLARRDRTHGLSPVHRGYHLPVNPLPQQT